jgi:hypothetical protein
VRPPLSMVSLAPRVGEAGPQRTRRRLNHNRRHQSQTGLAVCSKIGVLQTAWVVAVLGQRPAIRNAIDNSGGECRPCSYSQHEPHTHSLSLSLSLSAWQTSVKHSASPNQPTRPPTVWVVTASNSRRERERERDKTTQYAQHKDWGIWWMGGIEALGEGDGDEADLVHFIPKIRGRQRSRMATSPIHRVLNTHTPTHWIVSARRRPDTDAQCNKQERPERRTMNTVEGGVMRGGVSMHIQSQRT